MPPALAMRPDDALGAARGAMLIGASLPPVYAQAASLSRRIEALKRTRVALEQQQAQAADTAARLNVARRELDELLGAKREGSGKRRRKLWNPQGPSWKRLPARLPISRRFSAASRLCARRPMPAAMPRMWSRLRPQNTGLAGALARNSLLEPVVGAVENGSSGLSYATRPGAQVIAPADGKVLYAGPYHKNGQVLILEITTGYDVVLAGLGRVTVKPNDQLLAGEPVGTMPADPADNRLYFEIRHGGHGLSPAPWLKLNVAQLARELERRTVHEKDCAGWHGPGGRVCGGDVRAARSQGRQRHHPPMASSTCSAMRSSACAPTMCAPSRTAN